jgi:hypothetical protein
MGLKEYNKATLEDKNGQAPLECEINFDPKLKKYVRVTLGDTTSLIKIKDLYSFVFAVGDINQKANLLPTTRTYSKKLIRSHVVEVTEDVPKGGQVTIRCETDVPLSIYQKLETEALEKLQANQ